MVRPVRFQDGGFEFMGTKLNQIAFIFGIVGGIWMHRAWAQEGEYYYWDGDDKIALEAVPDQVVEFIKGEDQVSSGHSESSQDSLDPKDQPLVIQKLGGGARMLKLPPSEYSKVMQRKSPGSDATKEEKRSPVFRQHGEVKALPGGVLLTFAERVTQKEIEKFAKEKNLKLKRKLSFDGQAPVWLIEGPVGFPSLELANKLQEEAQANSSASIVRRAKPSFWTPIETRELKPIHFGPYKN